MNETKVVQEKSKVTVSINGEIKVFLIVNPKNVDVKKGHISFESLLGEALKNGKVGETVSYKTMSGKKVLTEILSIE